MNTIVRLLLWMLLLSFPAGAEAGHQNVPFLEGAIPVRAGMCTFTSDTGSYTVICEQYIKQDGKVYLALYLDGEIVIVRELDETGEAGAVVWSKDQEPEKPHVDERGA